MRCQRGSGYNEVIILTATDPCHTGVCITLLNHLHALHCLRPPWARCGDLVNRPYAFKGGLEVVQRSCKRRLWRSYECGVPDYVIAAMIEVLTPFVALGP